MLSIYTACVRACVWQRQCGRYCASLPAARSVVRTSLGTNFPHLSRPVPRPTRPPIQCVPRPFSGAKTARAWRWPPTTSGAEAEETVELYLYTPIPVCLHSMSQDEYMHTHTHIHTYIHTCMICVYVCVCIYIYIYVCVCVCVCVYCL